MNRRSLLLRAGAGALAAALPVRNVSAASSPSRATPLDRGIVIDALVHPGETDPYAPLTAKTLDDLRKSGLTAVNVTVGGIGNYARDFETTVRNVAYWNAQIAAHPDRLMLVRTALDITQAKRNGQLGLIYGFQDGTPLGEDLARVDLFADLGIRVIQLTYNRRNLIADGCLEPSDGGLSKFGREVIERLNARNLLIDLSHGSERTTRGAIEASTAPVAITHTGCAAIAALPRNKTDAELKLLAQRGGVVGIYLISYFLSVQGQPTAQDLLRHIEHAVKVCGEDHVGIGTDGLVSTIELTEEYRTRYAKRMAERRARGLMAPGEREEIVGFLPDLNSPDRYARIADLLAARGHPAARIDKILGGNFARLFADVWGSGKPA